MSSGRIDECQTGEIRVADGRWTNQQLSWAVGILCADLTTIGLRVVQLLPRCTELLPDVETNTAVRSGLIIAQP